MEYFKGVFCISTTDLEGMITGPALHMYIQRYPHIRMRRGGGVNCPALLNYELLRQDLKEKIAERYGDVKQFAKKNRLQELIEPDPKASTYFEDYEIDDDKHIDAKKQEEYYTNAKILNAVGKYVAEKDGKCKRISAKSTGIWQIASDAVNSLDKSRYNHDLPTNPIRLKEKYTKYLIEGYESLIHKGHKNSNARKVTPEIENLLLSLYCMKNIPFGKWVHEDYLKFIEGELDIVDVGTGELLAPEDFWDKGIPVHISRGAVWRYFNIPTNKIKADRLRNNRIDHITHSTPHNWRHAPEFSMSKITMDDRALPRKTSDGKWLSAYAAADVCSGAILSCVYSTEAPSVAMVWDCLRELYRTVDTNRLVWPNEAEVENHLMRDIEESLKMIFKDPHFTTPGVSRDKRMEHIWRSKKYGDEKRFQVGVGRHTGKGAFKTKSPNKDEDYKQERIAIERLIAEDRESIQRHNDTLHPNQKLYPGMTRWQVLLENQNPDLSQPKKYKLLRYLGHKTPTTLRNNDYVQVQYEKYAIDRLELIDRLKPNAYGVEAYYLPDTDGSIGEVFLYQGDTFISKATIIERYNEARCERTEKDEQIRTGQAKRQAHFFKFEKEGVAQLRKLEVMKPIRSEIKVEIVENLPNQEEDIEVLLERYKNMTRREKSINDI